jgi:P-type E1-E2 ATPase
LNDQIPATQPDQAGLRAWVTVDGELAGAIDYADRLRPDLQSMFARLATLGIERTMLLTGDHVAHADRVARQLGIAEVRADLLPGDKLAVVETLERQGERVVMLGDGTNDAPALRRATVGVALAAHGGGISAEAADAVILADDPTRLADAIQISRRTLGIARQSVWAGLGLTSVAMVAAAFGHIPPTLGALLQEVIDVAVILNALRASGSGRRTSTAGGSATAKNLSGGRAQQAELQPDPRIQISDISLTGHSGR